jgi:hypothetical protein
MHAGGAVVLLTSGMWPWYLALEFIEGDSHAKMVDSPSHLEEVNEVGQ